MNALFQRTVALLGEEKVARLRSARVLVVGVGGVGGCAAEQLCRAGIGALTLLDGDRVDPTNLNRQLAALGSTVGRFKAEVLCERFRDIDPEGTFTPEVRFLKPDECDELLGGPFDLVVDAIDDVPAKVGLLRAAVGKKIPAVSSMGAGGKTDPAQVRCADIGKTFGDPLARRVRQELRRAGVTKGVPCVFSPEERQQVQDLEVIGTVSYMPAVFGCHLAAAALKILLERTSGRAM